MKSIICLSFVTLLFSCTPLRNTQLKKATLPDLGTTGKPGKNLLSTDFYTFGKPSLSKPIAVALKEVPFNRSEFNKFEGYKTARGQETGFVYVDSLPNKPTYFRLEIIDIIAMQQQLNSNENKEVRAYLAKEEEAGLVTHISFQAASKHAQSLAKAQGIFLTENHHGLLELECVVNKERQRITLSDLDIFDYKTASFCWELDRYGKEKIATLSIDGTNCPKGTTQKAHKLDNTKTYLKI